MAYTEISVEISKDGKSWISLGEVVELHVEQVGGFQYNSLLPDDLLPAISDKLQYVVNIDTMYLDPTDSRPHVIYDQFYNSVCYLKWDVGEPYFWKMQAELVRCVISADSYKRAEFELVNHGPIEHIAKEPEPYITTASGVKVKKPKLTVIAEDGKEVDLTDAVVGWDLAAGPDETVLTGTAKVSGTIYPAPEPSPELLAAAKSVAKKIKGQKPAPKPVERASLLEIDEEVEDESKD